MILELTTVLHQADERKTKESKKADDSTEASLGLTLESGVAMPVKASVEGSLSTKAGQSHKH